jgi:hypothetical protein
MSAFWIFPFDVLVWAADTAASTFMTAFVAYLHPRSLPFIHFGWAKYRANFIGAFRHANVMVKNS